MLGTVERAKVRVLLDLLAAGDGAGLMGEVERIASFAPDFAQVLDELAGLLHRIQLVQLVPDAADEGDAELGQLAGRLAPQDVQLWYQMAVTGRRDLPLAPTPRVGFEMSLLRMLAFAPAAAAAGSRAATVARPSAEAPMARPAAPRRRHRQPRRPWSHPVWRHARQRFPLRARRPRFRLRGPT